MSVAEGMKASPSQTRQGALYLPRTSGKRSSPGIAVAANALTSNRKQETTIVEHSPRWLNF